MRLALLSQSWRFPFFGDFPHPGAGTTCYTCAGVGEYSRLLFMFHIWVGKKQVFICFEVIRNKLFKSIKHFFSPGKREKSPG